jgi:hypothetical protein
LEGPAEPPWKKRWSLVPSRAVHCTSCDLAFGQRIDQRALLVAKRHHLVVLFRDDLELRHCHDPVYDHLHPAPAARRIERENELSRGCKLPSYEQADG